MRPRGADRPSPVAAAVRRRRRATAVWDGAARKPARSAAGRNAISIPPAADRFTAPCGPACSSTRRPSASRAASSIGGLPERHVVPGGLRRSLVEQRPDGREQVRLAGSRLADECAHTARPERDVAGRPEAAQPELADPEPRFHGGTMTRAALRGIRRFPPRESGPSRFPVAGTGAEDGCRNGDDLGDPQAGLRAGPRPRRGPGARSRATTRSSCASRRRASAGPTCTSTAGTTGRSSGSCRR